MTKLYQISATLTHHTTDGNGLSQQKVIQIPTFYLSPRVQGIISTDHAKEIAKSVILPITMQYESAEIHIDATFEEVW